MYNCLTSNIEYLSVKCHVINCVSIYIFVYYTKENDASGYTKFESKNNIYHCYFRITFLSEGVYLQKNKNKIEYKLESSEKIIIPT